MSSQTDIRRVHYLETHFPVDLLRNGHVPERFTWRENRNKMIHVQSVLDIAVARIRKRASRKGDNGTSRG